MADLPLFPLDVVVFPGMTVPLYVFEERYKSLLREAMRSDDRRFVIALADAGERLHDGPTGLAAYGAFVHVLTSEENADGTFQVLVHGQGRCRVDIVRTEHVEEATGDTRPLHFVADDPAPVGRGDPNAELVAAWDAIDTFRSYAETFFAFDALRQIDEALPEDPLYQSSFICANIRIPLASRQVLLEAPTLQHRFELAKKLMEERLAAHRSDDGPDGAPDGVPDDAPDASAS